MTVAAHKLARILRAMLNHSVSDNEPLGNPEQSRARRERSLRRQAQPALTTVNG